MHGVLSLRGVLVRYGVLRGKGLDCSWDRMRVLGRGGRGGCCEDWDKPCLGEMGTRLCPRSQSFIRRLQLVWEYCR